MPTLDILDCLLENVDNGRFTPTYEARRAATEITRLRSENERLQNGSTGVVAAGDRAAQVAILRAARDVPYLQEHYRKIADDLDDLAVEIETAPL